MRSVQSPPGTLIHVRARRDLRHGCFAVCENGSTESGKEWNRSVMLMPVSISKTA